jgi:hypothetical protein
MDWKSRFIKRAFAWTVVFMLAQGCAMAAVLYYWFVSAQGGGVQIPGSAFSSFVWPVAFGLAWIFGPVLWLCLRASFKKQAALAPAPEPVPAREKQGRVLPADAVVMTQRELLLNDQRRTLHLFSILQREGRLMDFFSEDLSAYEDAQIGAAARGVHEACGKAVEKYLVPAPVMEAEEGDDVRVEAGFDPEQIRLSGNVSGKPPFRGVLRHRGWRAGRLELPAFLSHGDPSLIAPAEVEVE